MSGLAELVPLRECLIEVTRGVGADWPRYPVLGVTRDGLAPAKEPVGKAPERYKPVEPGTIFYNPMRIMIGSIAMVDEGQPSGITSPDYVVIRTREGVLHHRFFYYWLRSSYGQELIQSLARGAVRERMMFNRLAEGVIRVPSWRVQQRIASALAVVPVARRAEQERLAIAEALPAAYLREVFEGPEAQAWRTLTLGDGLAEIQAGTSVRSLERPAENGEWGVLKVSAVSWGRFKPDEHKAVPTNYEPAPHERVRQGDLLISRSNTVELAGAVVIVREQPQRLMLSDKTLRLVTRADVFDSDYLEHALRTRKARQFIEGRATGTSYSMRNISQPTIRLIPVPAPSVATQRRIVTKLSRRLGEAEKLIGRLRDELALIDNLSVALLRRAFGRVSEGGDA